MTLRERIVSASDHFLPPEASDPKRIHRIRMAIYQAWTGIGFTSVFCALYTWAGSPLSAIAIGAIMVVLALVPFAIRRGTSLVTVGNAGIGITWLSTFVVVSRTGGLESPALAWTVLFPLFSYATCGARSASVWTALSCLQIAAFWMHDHAGLHCAQDLSPRIISALRFFACAGVVVATRIAPSLVEKERRGTFAAEGAENRAQERARILDDMHDGVGSQLVGVLVELRAGAVEPERLIAKVESCLDDLRLIVASLDPLDAELEVALGELRSRVADRFEAAGIALEWRSQLDGAAIEGVAVLQVLRSVQEMLTNALRHAKTRRVEVTLSATPREIAIAVRDFGAGFDPERPGAGRGLKSLRTRARRLGGTLTIDAREPGTDVCLRFPR